VESGELAACGIHDQLGLAHETLGSGIRLVGQRALPESVAGALDRLEVQLGDVGTQSYADGFPST